MLAEGEAAVFLEVAAAPLTGVPEYVHKGEISMQTLQTCYQRNWVTRTTMFNNYDI